MALNTLGMIGVVIVLVAVSLAGASLNCTLPGKTPEGWAALSLWLPLACAGVQRCLALQCFFLPSLADVFTAIPVQSRKKQLNPLKKFLPKSSIWANVNVLLVIWQPKHYAIFLAATVSMCTKSWCKLNGSVWQWHYYYDNHIVDYKAMGKLGVVALLLVAF